MNIDAAIAELAALKDGWLDGKCSALDGPGLQAFAQLFSAHYPDSLPVPAVVPTSRGDVAIGFKLGIWDISLDISLPSMSALLCAENWSSGRYVSKEFDVSGAPGWALFVETVTKLSQRANRFGDSSTEI